VEAKQYADQCSELFAAGGFAAVRRTAQAGLDEVGPDAALYRWLGQAHAAEDEDDHDAEAERAYRQGLALASDDLGLLVCYLELCVRADAFDHPARAARARSLQARVDELAPPGSPARERVDAVLGWAGRGYWDDVAIAVTARRTQYEENAELSRHVTDALRTGGGSDVPSGAADEDMRAAELAAALEILQGPANAPLRFLLAHRFGAYVTAGLAAFATNRLLVETGTVSFSLWGWLLWIPLLAADAKLSAARRLARRRVIARIEERHAREAAASAAD
jgi:hypothetical protein